MNPQTDLPPTSSRHRGRWLRWLLTAILSLLLIVIAGFLVWAMTPLGPTDAALAALESDDQVVVEQGEWLVFRPTAVQPNTGFIFYPGGHVDYRSYAPQMRSLAAQGYLAVIAPMPLSLAVFAPDKAADIVASFPEIGQWAVGGHSLGGAMAANFVFGNPEAVDGLALWAAYPADNNSLADHSLAVTSIYGTNDQVATPDTILASKPLLPPATGWVAIEGGNHAQFGSYGPQPGDGEPTISGEEQTREVVAATVKLLAGLGAGG